MFINNNTLHCDTILNYSYFSFQLFSKKDHDDLVDFAALFYIIPDIIIQN